MPVETATYIPELVPSNPETNDGIAQGDAHIQLIKQVLQNQFPDIGDVAVTATAAELNTVIGLSDATAGTLTAPIPTGSTTVGGSVVLKGAGTHADITLTNVEGGMSIMSGSQLCVLMDPVGNTTTNGALDCSEVEQVNVPLIPTGVITMWYGSIASIPTGWLLCDGTHGTPNLTGGIFVASADGVVLVPGQTGGANSVTGTSSSNGSHSHGGATASGGGQSLLATTDTQGAHSHGGSDGAYTLQIADIPSHTHSNTSLSNNSGGTPGIVGGTGTPTTLNTSGTGGGGAHSHTISTDGAHSHNVTVSSVNPISLGISTDGSHTHTTTVNTVPPFMALVYIMKS